MELIKTIIVSNSAIKIENLKKMLDPLDKLIKLEDFVKRLDETQGKIDEINPDLAFIELSEHDNFGFSFLKSLKKINFEIVFISSAAAKAIEAFRYSPIDFLLEPISQSTLINSIQKSIRRIKEKQNAISFINEKAENDPNAILRISTSNGLDFIKIKDILRFEADGVYTKLYLINGEKILSSTNLGKYEKLINLKSVLFPHRFFRIHHKHLVNMMHINIFSKGNGSIILVDNTEIKIAQRRLSNFKKKLLA